MAKTTVNFTDKLRNVTLSPPWVSYANEIAELFKGDPDVKVDTKCVDVLEDRCVRIYVTGQGKAEAIAKLLPEVKEFGNVRLKIMVIPSNSEEVSRVELIRRAFEGNENLSQIVTVEGIFSKPITYVVFKGKLVQYYDDDLGDLNGNRTTLYQEIAKEVLGEAEGIHFCTEELLSFDSRSNR